MARFSEIVDNLIRQNTQAKRKAQREQTMLDNIVATAHMEAEMSGGSVQVSEGNPAVIVVRFPNGTGQDPVTIKPVIHWDGQGYELETDTYRSDRFTSVEDGATVFFEALDDVLQP